MAPQPGDLGHFDRGVQPQALDRLERGAGRLGHVGKPVDADDDLLAALDRLLRIERRLVDRALHRTRLDGGQRAALRVDVRQDGAGLGL